MVAIGAAVIDIKAVSVVETRLWTFLVPEDAWEPRSVDQFWSKFPAQRHALTNDPATLVTPAEFVDAWTTWTTDVKARAGTVSVPLWSDFPAFDLAWLSLILVRGGGKPCYFAPPAFEWQSTLDIDAFVEGVRASMSLDPTKATKLESTLANGKALYPDGDHYPDKDAACMGLRFAHLLWALSLS